MNGITQQLFLLIAMTLTGYSATAEEIIQDVGCDPGCGVEVIPHEGLWERSTLTGDWFGHRDAIAEHGVTFQGDITQFYQGVTTGGVERTFEYGGHSDYVLNFNLGQLGAWEGLFLKVRGESQFGEFVNREAGSILAVNNQGLLPVPGEQETALTNFLLTQFLSERVAVFAGKLDTLDGDMNAFAHGRGKTQFMNAALVVNPIAFRTVPYSTYGAGFSILDGTEPIFSFIALDPEDKALEGPVDLYGEGVTLSAELRLPTYFFELPGHQMIAGTWSSRDVPDLNRLLFLEGGEFPEVSDSWSLYWNFDQYLVVDSETESQGWGVFGRAGIADAQSNPLAWFLSFGVGGNSPLARREQDTFGIGWYYASNSNELPGLLLEDHGQGVELFYNVAVTPWFHVTPDLQIIDSSRRNVDTALVFGLRANITL